VADGRHFVCVVIFSRKVISLYFET
jgi:hypothetical protein